jgi:hypothetical protein
MTAPAKEFGTCIQFGRSKFIILSGPAGWVVTWGADVSVLWEFEVVAVLGAAMISSEIDT